MIYMCYDYITHSSPRYTCYTEEEHTEGHSCLYYIVSAHAFLCSTWDIISTPNKEGCTDGDNTTYKYYL